MDVISGAKVLDPEELIINQEEFDDIEVKMADLLSDLERKVLLFILRRTNLSRNFRGVKQACKVY